MTETEPLPAKDPLGDAPNLLLTPHISGGYHMKEVFDTIFEITLENLKKYRVGEALRNQVDRKVGY